MTPKNLKPTLAAVALGSGLLAATALYAQETAPPGTPMEPGKGGMMGHDGMMGMMTQMNRMMESCGKMMESMDDTPNAPDGQPAPAPRG